MFDFLSPRKEVPVLVLSRKINERILIGKDIAITVVGICGDKVRVGIDAPRSLTVHREEVVRRIENGEPERRRK